MTGNKYVFICNERFWHSVQAELFDFLAHFHTDGTYLWSKQANDYVKVGATFDTYEFGGNSITFAVDRTFSREYGLILRPLAAWAALICSLNPGKSEKTIWSYCRMIMW